MRITTSSSLLIISAAVLLMGQSCSLPGLSQPSAQPDGGVYRSDNHGQSWKQKSAGLTNDSRGIKYFSVRTIRFDPRDPDRLTIGTLESGVWISTNAGENWKPTTIKTGEVPCLSAKSTDADVQYASLGGTVQKSLDNGLTWASVYADGQGQAITCVMTDRTNPDMVWATSSGGKLLRSDDNGKSWAISLQLKPIAPRQMVQDDQMPGHIYIFTKTNGIVDVDTANKSWQDLSGGLKKYRSGAVINGVAISFGTPTVWTVATGYGLLQSFDRGSTWSIISTLVTPGSTAIQNVAVNPRDQQEMLITVGSKLHHTRDGGKSWTVLSIPTSRRPVSLTFDPVRVDRLYIGTYLEPQK